MDLKSFKKIYKFHGIGIFSDDPFAKQNSISFILTNLKLKFEPGILNLIWK